MPEVPWISRGAGKVIRDNEEIARSIKGTGDAYDDVTRRARELQRVANKINRDHETAKERFTRMSVNAKSAFDQEKISGEKLQKELTRITVEYLRQTDANDKLRTSRKLQQAEVQREIANLPKLTSETQRLMQGYTQTGVELGNLAVAQRSAFGPAALSRLVAFGAKLASAAIAAQALKRGITGQAEASSDVGRRAISASRAAGGLAQLRGGDELKGLQAASRLSFAEGGFETLDEAHRLTFELDSGGMIADREFWSRLAQSRLVGDVGQVAVTTGLVREGFGGTSRQILSEALAAAGPATGAEIEDIQQGLALTAGTAKTLGVTRNETQAVISRISQITGSGKTAGTQTESLFTALIKRGFADDPGKYGNLQAMLEAVNAKSFKESELHEFFGRREAARGMAQLKDMDAYRARLAEIQAASDSGLINQRIEDALAIPEIGTARSTRAARAAGFLAAEKKGLRTERVRAEYDAMRERLTGNPWWVSGPLHAASYAVDWIIPDAWEDPGTMTNQDRRAGGGSSRTGVDDRILNQLEGQTSIVGAPKQPPAGDPGNATVMDVLDALHKQTAIMEREERRQPVGGRRE